jgi:hypothetical protein
MRYSILLSYIVAFILVSSAVIYRIQEQIWDKTNLVSVQRNEDTSISPWDRVHYGLVRTANSATGDVDAEVERKIQILRKNIEQILSPPNPQLRPKLKKSVAWGGLNPPTVRKHLIWHPTPPLCAVPILADINGLLHPDPNIDCSGAGSGESGKIEWHRPLMPVEDRAERLRRTVRRLQLERAALRRLSARSIVSAEDKMGRYYRGGMKNIAKVPSEWNRPARVEARHTERACARRFASCLKLSACILASHQRR